MVQSAKHVTSESISGMKSENSKVDREASKSQKKFGEASRKLVKAIKFSKTLIQAEKVSISHEIQEQSSKSQ